MSVFVCERRNCPGLMCRRRSLVHGYICDNCFNELVELGADADVKAFMESEPSPGRGLASYYAWSLEFEEF